MLVEDPVRVALTTAHSGLASVAPGAWRYPADVSPFVAFDSVDALAGVVGVGEVVVALCSAPVSVPAGWSSLGAGVVHQLAFEASVVEVPPPALPVRELGDDDVPSMLALVEMSRPGPFLPRTHTLGRYVGAFDGSALVAMAGERMRVPGRVEVSAVTTAPPYRGRGLAAALTSVVVDGIVRRGEVPFLHVTEGNPARRVYEAMGFSWLGDVRFTELRREAVTPPS
jgi:ribosomal protein S18 acetylase RimI-like enzyme